MVKVNRTAKRGRQFKLSEDDVDQLVALYNEGIIVRKIAERFDISTATVRRYLRLRRNNVI